MKDQLREYIDGLFRDAQPTKKTVEMKEEILQNLLDKYNDLLAEGKSPEAAYNIAVASVGDLGPLIAELRNAPEMTEEEKQMWEDYRKRRALFTSVAVGMYILSVIPMLLFGNRAGAICMFLLIAIATGMLIYINMSKPQQGAETMADEFREWRQTTSNQRQLYKALSGALWALTLVIYFVISFSMGNWHLTWLVFPIAGACNAILRAVFDLQK